MEHDFPNSNSTISTTAQEFSFSICNRTGHPSNAPCATWNSILYGNNFHRLFFYDFNILCSMWDEIPCLTLATSQTYICVSSDADAMCVPSVVHVREYILDEWCVHLECKTCQGKFPISSSDQSDFILSSVVCTIDGMLPPLPCVLSYHTQRSFHHSDWNAY